MTKSALLLFAITITAATSCTESTEPARSAGASQTAIGRPSAPRGLGLGLTSDERVRPNPRPTERPAGAVAVLGTPDGKGGVGHSDLIINLVFYQRNRTLITADTGGSILYWDVKSGDQKRRIRLARKEEISDLALDSKEQRLYVSSRKPRLLILNPSSGRPIRQLTKLPAEIPGAKEAVFPPKLKSLTGEVHLAEEAGIVALASSGALLLRMKDLSPIRFLKEPTVAFCSGISPDGETLAWLDELGGFELYNTSTGKLLRKTPTSEHVGECGFSADFSRAVLIAGGAMVVDLKRGKTLFKDTKAADLAVITPDGKIAAYTVGEQTHVRVVAVDTRKAIRTLPVCVSEDDNAVALGISRDGRLLAAGCATGLISVWPLGR